MTTLRIIGRLAVVALAAAVAFNATAAKRDFDGDGKSDVAWFAPEYPPGGSALWLMSGPTPTSGTLIGPTGWWWVSHTGDLNGDGTADLIIPDKWTGTTGVRLMQGTTEIATAALHTSEITVVTHVADFDGDGKADLLWLDSNAGVTALWLMDGLTVIGSNSVPLGDTWVVQVGDFDGDKHGDLVTQRCIPLSECYINHDAVFSNSLMDGLQVKATAPLMRSDYWYLVP